MGESPGLNIFFALIIGGFLYFIKLFCLKLFFFPIRLPLTNGLLFQGIVSWGFSFILGI